MLSLPQLLLIDLHGSPSSFRSTGQEMLTLTPTCPINAQLPTHSVLSTRATTRNAGGRNLRHAVKEAGATCNSSQGSVTGAASLLSLSLSLAPDLRPGYCVYMWFWVFLAALIASPPGSSFQKPGVLDAKTGTCLRLDYRFRFIERPVPIWKSPQGPLRVNGFEVGCCFFCSSCSEFLVAWRCQCKKGL